MKPLITGLLLFSLAVPTHAASPRGRHTVNALCVQRARVVTNSRAAAHHSARTDVVVTPFAVPVAVPVAPFAPYWYGISDYQHAPSLRGSASEPVGSFIAQHCTSCHGRTSPKQGLSLIDPLSLSDRDRLRAIRAVITGEMPPDTEPPLTEADRQALLRELAAP